MSWSHKTFKTGDELLTAANNALRTTRLSPAEEQLVGAAQPLPPAPGQERFAELKNSLQARMRKQFAASSGD